MAQDLETLAQPTALSSDESMVWIPGGTFLMGSDNHYPEEAPAHNVKRIRTGRVRFAFLS
jgi:sulfatase modifying factor 1